MKCTALALAVAAVASSCCVRLATADCAKPPDGFAVPSEAGLDQCVGNNFHAIAQAVFSPDSECSMSTLEAIQTSQPLGMMLGMMATIAMSPDHTSTMLHTVMRDTNDTVMAALCQDYRALIVPCAKTLVPLLLRTIREDTECCGEISDTLDMLQLFVPSGQNAEAFLLNGIVDAMNHFLCATRDDGSHAHCAVSLFQQLTAAQAHHELGLLNSFLMPFVSAMPGEECDAMQGKPYASSLTKTRVTAPIAFGCCVDHLRPLLTTIHIVAQQVTGNNMIELFNGMFVDSHPEGAFIDALAQASRCEYADTCYAPQGLIRHEPIDAIASRTASDLNQVKTLTGTECNMTSKCDKAGEVCSDVCDRGSVHVDAWVQATLRFQRQLAFQGPVCRAQLPGTHNSAITLADGFGNRDQLVNKYLNPAKPWSFLKTNNQVLSLTDQLQMGVRWLELDVHLFFSDLRIAHCGGMGSVRGWAVNPIASLLSRMSSELEVYGGSTWNPSLLGCYPSLSGIKVEEQRPVREALNEIRAWLDAHSTSEELVMLYLNMGDEVRGSEPAVVTLNALIREIFGSLLVPHNALQSLQASDWTTDGYGTTATLAQQIANGHRVLLLADIDTGLAFDIAQYCGGHDFLSTAFLHQVPDHETKVLGGVPIYSHEAVIRSYQSALRYISVSESGEFSREQPPLLTAETIPLYVRWNVNFVSPDDLSVAMMRAQTWSWAESEPSRASSKVTAVVMDQASHWRVVNATSVTHKACWRAKEASWAVEPIDTPCHTGYTFIGPQDALQNYLLHVELLKRTDIARAGVAIAVTYDYVAPTIALPPTLAPSPSPSVKPAPARKSERC